MCIWHILVHCCWTAASSVRKMFLMINEMLLDKTAVIFTKNSLQLTRFSRLSWRIWHCRERASSLASELFRCSVTICRLNEAWHNSRFLSRTWQTASETQILSLTYSTLEDVTAIPSTLYSNTEILLCLSCSSVVASFSLSDSLSLSQRCRSLLSTSRCWRLALVCSSLCSVVWSCLARWLRQARVSRRICFMPLISFLCLERIWECATQSKMKTKSSKKIIVASI